jgi:hypothetical protein
MGKLIFHYLPNLYVDESEAGSASHITSSMEGDLPTGIDYYSSSLVLSEKEVHVRYLNSVLIIETILGSSRICRQIITGLGLPLERPSILSLASCDDALSGGRQPKYSTQPNILPLDNRTAIQ